MSAPEPETISFKTARAFNVWLKKNHTTSPGIWLQLYKKGSGVKTIVYAKAVDEALCYGWIDSQVKKFDEHSYVQKFTPRRSKSLWSKINREKVVKLINKKRMRPAGLAEIERAKKDGRWESAYDSPKSMVVPKDFLKALSKNKKAKAFFETLNKTNVYAVAWRLQTAKKPETRERRMKAMVEMLKKGEKLY